MRGRVVNAQTGQPIEGVSVSIARPSMGYTAMDSSRTLQDGSFKLIYVSRLKNSLDVLINHSSSFNYAQYDKCLSYDIIYNISPGVKNIGDIMLNYRC